MSDLDKEVDLVIQKLENTILNQRKRIEELEEELKKLQSSINNN